MSCLLQCVAVCCSVLQCVAVCCSALQCAAVCCSVLQCVAVCCSVLQCVAVCCSVCGPSIDFLFVAEALGKSETFFFLFEIMLSPIQISSQKSEIAVT